jgi:hypothetical protein
LEREDNILVLLQVPGLARASAEALVDNGYTSVEELAYVPQEELLSESGLAVAEVLVLRAAARDFLSRKASGDS